MDNFIKILCALALLLFFAELSFAELGGAGDLRTFGFDTMYIFESSRGDSRDLIEGSISGADYQVYGFTPLFTQKTTDDLVYTFRTSFSIPAHLQNEELCLFLSATAYPYDIYLNGHKIYKTGEYGTSYTSSDFYGRMIYLTPALLNKTTVNQVVFQVFPRGQARVLADMYIGTYKKISFDVFWYTFFHYTLIVVFCGLSTFYFLIFFMLWLTGRYRTKTYLYFSLMCLSLVFAYLNIVFCYPEVSELVFWKISRFSYCFGAVFLLLFTFDFTGIRIEKPFVYILLALVLAALAALLFPQDSIFEVSKAFHLATVALILPVIIFVPVLFAVSLFKNKSAGTLIIFLSILVVVGAAIYDLQELRNFRNPYVWLLPYGYIIMEFSIAVILALDQAVMTKKIASQSRELSSSYKELMAAKEKTELASKAKSTFLATVAHEFRTPISCMDGSVQLLFDTCADTQQRRHIEGISSAAKRLTAVINDVLDYSVLESGTIELDISNFDLKETINEILKSMERDFTQKGLELLFNYNSEIPVTFSGDQMRISRILRNLLENSLKFTQKGCVVLDVAYINKKGGSNVLITLSDTGIGIPTEKLAKIFLEFEHGEDSLTKEYEGLGLGLSITSKIVYLMGGTITVDSCEGKGTTLKLRLPLPVVSFGKKFKRIDLSGMKVLVVEDNPVNSQIMCRFLDKMKIVYDQAGNGQMAVEKFQTDVYDAIFMDIQMPVMNGLEATQKIREMEKEKGGRVPIIAVTANADKKECIEAGMDGYLVKPIRKDLVKNELIKFCLNES